MKIYWLHLKEHSNIFTQGYIGITCNLDKRIKEHKRAVNTKSKKNYHITNAIKLYGWDNILIDVLSECDHLEEALKIENKYRPKANIGWNTMAGGGNGYKLSKITKNKISISMLGNSNTKGFSKNIIICPNCNKEGQFAAMQRWHFNNCKYY